MAEANSRSRFPRFSSDSVLRYTKAGLWEGHLIDAYVALCAESNPDRLAVVDDRSSWTYGRLDAAINQAAHLLLNLGIGSSDVVSWQLPNWVEGIIVHHAALRIGAVSNPIVPIYREREVGFILREAKSRVVIVPRTFRNFDFLEMVDDLRPSLPDLQHVLTVVPGSLEPGTFGGLLSSMPTAPPVVVRDANAISLLLYTSGTTADPKGALHTHNTLDYESRSIIELFGLDGDDAVFMPSPITHITGILYGMQMPFVLGSHVVLVDVWDPGRALELIEFHRCSFMLAATPFLNGLIAHPDAGSRNISSLRVFACGGADVPPELILRATEKLACHVARVYGSTEFPTATCSGMGDPLEKRATTDGRAIGLAQIRTDGSAEGGVHDDGAGELFVRGPELFVGYLNQELNARCFDGDGWFATGDLATIDADGFLTITGRKKDIIIRGGENISAKDVEDQLFTHPDIADVAVVGYPEERLGERVAAVVVPTAGSSIELGDIVRWLQGRGLAMQKIPERLVVVDALPRTASGKVQKFVLRELVAVQINTGRR